MPKRIHNDDNDDDNDDDDIDDGKREEFALRALKHTCTHIATQNRNICKNSNFLSYTKAQKRNLCRNKIYLLNIYSVCSVQSYYYPRFCFVPNHVNLFTTHCIAYPNV